MVDFLSDSFSYMSLYVGYYINFKLDKPNQLEALKLKLNKYIIVMEDLKTAIKRTG